MAPRLCLDDLFLLLVLLEVLSRCFSVQAGLAVQKRVLFDGAAAGETLLLTVLTILALSVVAVVRGWGNVGNFLGHRVLATDGGDADV